MHFFSSSHPLSLPKPLISHSKLKYHVKLCYISIHTLPRVYLTRPFLHQQPFSIKVAQRYHLFILLNTLSKTARYKHELGHLRLSVVNNQITSLDQPSWHKHRPPENTIHLHKRWCTVYYRTESFFKNRIQ